MNISDSQYHTIVKLADEYLARIRCGERPSVTEYVERFPELADGIRDVFPMSAMLEGAGAGSRTHAAGAGDSRTATRSRRVPEQLGNYRILREIGCGGMGTIYEAEDLRLKRRVALKCLHTGGGLAPGHRERFEREARSAAKLHHTNIVPVFDVSDQDGTTFYAMQLIRGRGLDKVLDELRQLFEAGRDDTLPLHGEPSESSIAGLTGNCGDSQLARLGNPFWRSVARIGIQAADALQYAHDHGTLHRDIKPSNLLLDASGIVWVADFGLAQTDDEAGLTQTGELVGTLRYMAPERFEGQCDSRSDVYGLGLSLYELATFRPAFSASSRHRLIQQVTQEDPPRPRRVNPAIPRDLETILLKAIAREPGRRYQTASELKADLVRFVEDKPIKARRSGVFERGLKWSKRRPLVAGLLAAVILSTLLGVAGITLQWRKAERLAANEQLALEEKSRAIDEKTQALDDADQANREAQFQIARLHEATGLRLLDRGEWHHAALWMTQALAIDERLASAGSADHQHRLDFGRRRLAQLWLGSPRLTALKAFPSYRCHALTDDGSLCITDDGQQCTVWDITSGDALYPPLAAQLAWPRAVSPDGERLLVFDQRGVRVHELQTGRLLMSCNQRIPMLASWGCDGERIVALNLQGILCIWDAASGVRVAPERDLGAPPAIQRGMFAFAVSQDGERLAIAVKGRQVPVLDVRTGALIAECPTMGQATGVALSAGGTQLAVQSRVLQVCNVASGEQTARFDFPLEHVRGHLVAFSPDGTHIACGDYDGVVHVRDLATGEDVFAPLKHAATVHSVAYSHDGQFLVTAARDATVRLWNAADGLPIGPALRHDEAAAARFSTDDRAIVTATHSGTMRLWDTASIGEATVLAGHRSPVSSARFSRDGRRLVTGGGQTVRVWDVQSGEEQPPPLETSAGVRSLSLNADGSLILMIFRDQRVRLWETGSGWSAIRDDSEQSAGASEPLEVTDVRLAEIDASGRWLLLGRDRGYGIFDRSEPVADSGFVRLGSQWDRASGAAFDSAGDRALVYSSYGSVHVVETETRETLLKRPPKHKTLHPDVVWAGLRPNADEALVALSDGTVERWRIPSAAPFAAFTVNALPVRVGVHPAGDRLVIAGRDHTIRLWDVVHGIPLTPPVRHAEQILHVEFSRDGKSFVTTSADGIARVWDTLTGQPISPLLRHAGAVRWAEFSPDGQQVVTAGDDGIVRLWPLATAEDRPADVLLRMARLYSARRIESAAGSVPLTGPELERLFQDLRADARR